MRDNYPVIPQFGGYTQKFINKKSKEFLMQLLQK
jgi:hypothetical protein